MHDSAPEILGQCGLTSAQIEAVQAKLKSGGTLSDACFDQELSEVERQRLAEALLGVPCHQALDQNSVDPQFTQRIPIRYARRFHVLGLRVTDGVMPVVTHDLGNAQVVDYIAMRMHVPTVLHLAPQAVIDRLINAAYAEHQSDFDEVLESISDEPLDLASVDALDEGDLLDNATRAPVIKLVNMILFEAVKAGASDVHVQPHGDSLQVRYRIDGVLHDRLTLPDTSLDEVISRIKVIGKMDIAEKRLAQDGRTTVTIGERIVDLRISIIPTSHGERAVLRLLDKSARLYKLPDLGMSACRLQTFEQLIKRTHGIILVTGPTGSGKSTTLYAALQYLDCQANNILTLEDPIEYQLEGISQTQVSNKKGMTFATGLRAVLRQDPDIIMVGEIRDEETARMAIQSSLTGHLVLSTLHTNDAAGAISRMLDLGIEPHLVASSLLAVLAQRLVRVVCAECGAQSTITEDDCRALGLDAHTVGQTVLGVQGCAACNQTGYRGRQGVFELLVVDETIRELIVQRAKSSEIKEQAMRCGMATLRQDSVRQCLEHKTTLEEVARVTTEDEPLSQNMQVDGD